MSQKFIMLLATLLVTSILSSSVFAQEAKRYTLEALEAMKKKEQGSREIVRATDEELKERLENISGQIPMKYNTLVKAHIKAYTERRRGSTETIIGRSVMYFSTFEEALIRHGLPTDLKYMTIVESALDPKATSPVGAKGLWQFMSSTGKRYGLRISKYVDERSDPYMSSDAAARFLTDLHDRYDDWLLSIAAYNCGPGRVNKALRYSKQKDYWNITGYLPRETRNYVPSFMAVAYTMNYYHLHNIYPTYPEYDLQVTDKVKVFNKISFNEISKITGVSLEVIKKLNPSYHYDFIPMSSSGYVLTLPLTKMEAFKAAYPEAQPLIFASAPRVDYERQTTASSLSNTNTTVSNVTYEQVEKVYTVVKGDNLSKIANTHGCRVSDLRTWNNLKGSILRIGQKLTIMETRVVERKIEAPAVATTATSPEPIPMGASYEAYKQEAVKTEKILHKVEHGESLVLIASKYDNVSIQKLMEWNGFNAASKVYPGMQLVIYETK